MQDSNIPNKTQPAQSVIAELGRAMSWSSQGTKKKDKNYSSLISSDSVPPSTEKPHSPEPAKERNSCYRNQTKTPSATTCSGTTSSTAATVCGGDCGNIMCSLSPACIEDNFEDRTCSSPQSLDDDDKDEDDSLRRRTKSEGCYSTAYRGKSSRKNSPSLDSSRELLSPSAPEDTDELDDVAADSGRIPHSASLSTWSGRVKDLKRDLKHRICKLRSAKTPSQTQTISSNPVPLDMTISTESMTRESEHATSEQLSSSNHAFREEEETPVVSAQVLGRARALVDYTPSPYDKDGLAFKKGDVIDILAKSSSGYWVGRNKNQVGHFKFINVEEIQNGERKNNQRRMSSFEQRFSSSSKTLEDLLEYLGLESYMNVLVLNGYHNIDSLKGLEEQDLMVLGIANGDHRVQLLDAVDRLGEPFPATSCASDSMGSPLRRSKATPFQTKRDAFNSPRKHSESYSDNLFDPYVQCLSNNTDLFPVDSSEINNLDHDLTRYNGVPIKGDESGEVLNIPPNKAPDKLFLYSDLQSNQKIHYSYGGGFSAFSEQLYFTRSGLVLDSPTKDRFLSEMNYLEKLSDLSVAGTQFNHLNGAVLPNCGAYITKEEKYLMESSRRKLKDKVLSYEQDVNLEHLRDESNFSGYLQHSAENPESSYFSAYPDSQSNGKSLTLPRKGYPSNDRIFKAAVSNVCKSDRKGKKTRRRKESSQPLLQCSVQPYTLCDFVAKKLQEEQIDLSEEPYTDKTGFCGIPPALVQRYADELQQDIYDVAEALDRERVHALQRRGRLAVPNDFLADSCCEPVVEANYDNLSSWLISLGLPIYEPLFRKHGCSELYHMAGLKDTDLHRYGIGNSKHIRLLKTAIEALHIHIEHCQYVE